jgi:hypothetical protein
MTARTRKAAGKKNQQRETPVLVADRPAFLAAYTRGDLAGMVAIAREAARERIWVNGIDSDNLDLVADLAGSFPMDERTREAWNAYTRGVAAAFALGIGIGQLVHPDVFTMRGAK